MQQTVVNSPLFHCSLSEYQVAVKVYICCMGFYCHLHACMIKPQKWHTTQYCSSVVVVCVSHTHFKNVPNFHTERERTTFYDGRQLLRGKNQYKHITAASSFKNSKVCSAAAAVEAIVYSCGTQ